MKRIILLFFLAFSIFNFQFSISFAQSWKELMDSTDIYHDKQDFGTALKWAKLAMTKAEKEFAEKDTNYAESLLNLAEAFHYYGSMDSAIYFQEKHLQLVKEACKGDHKVVAKSKGNLASMYMELNRVQEAGLLYKESLDMYRRLYKEDYPDLANSINSMAKFLDKCGKNQEADSVLKEAFDMYKRLYKGDHHSLALIIQNTGMVQYNKGKNQEAESLFKDALAMYRRLYKEDNRELAYSLAIMGTFLRRSERYDEAEPYLKESLEMYRRLHKSDHKELSDIICEMAYFLQLRARYQEAEPLFKEALEMNRRLYKGDHPELSEVIGKTAAFLEEMGRHQEAEPLLRENVEMNRRIYKTDNTNLSNSINNLGLYLSEMGKYQEAESLMKEALEMDRRLYKGDHPYLATGIMNMGLYYNHRGMYNEAESLFKEALDMYRRIYKGDHTTLAICINNMASFYYIRGRYKETEPLLKEGLEMFRRLFKGDHPKLAILIGNMATFLSNQGRYHEAEPLYKEALEMKRRLFKSDCSELATGINNMAVFLDERGRYQEAEPLLKESLEMTRRTYKVDHPELVGSIYNMAHFLNGWGRYQEAEPLFKEGYEMARRLYKVDHPSLAVSINSLALFLDERGRYQEAGPLYKEALEMLRRLYKGDQYELANSIFCVASYLEDHGKNQEAEPLYNESLEMRRRLYKVDHPELATSIRCLAHFLKANGRYKEAESLYKETLAMSERLYSNEHSSLAYCLIGLADLYQKTGRSDSAMPLFDRVYDMTLKRARDYFPYLNEQQKVNFWANKMETRINDYYKFGTEYFKQKPEISEKLADITLATKGIVLNSTHKALSKARLMKRMFEDWQNTRQYWLHLVQNPQKARQMGINIDSVGNAASELEKEISSQSLDFKKAFDTSLVRWKDVQGTLNPGEASIEIVRVRGNKDTISYLALITKKDTKIPEMVVLDYGKELEEIYIKNYAALINKQRNGLKLNLMDLENLGMLYNKFWKPVQNKIPGIKTVYISLDGVYNEFNLNTLLNSETNKYIVDEIDLRLITSSRDLVKRNTPLNPLSRGENKVKLFGDPTFELKKEVNLPDPDTTGLSQATRNYYLGGILNFIAQRGIAALPGTKVEIKKISKDFAAKNWKVEDYLGETALEENIKNAKNPRILHLATHGVFLKDVEYLTQEMEFENKKYVENPLLRSMLLFAGAENTIKGETSGNLDRDDGILTAFEAMNLDLDNTELVVLSACETGLGEVRNGEGVYGLQRAFQVAGAKSLIMSLWTVSDAATQELMTSFYEKWLSGMSKRESFRAAQQELKKKYPGFYYWGAFVMVGE